MAAMVKGCRVGVAVAVAVGVSLGVAVAEAVAVGGGGVHVLDASGRAAICVGETTAGRGWLQAASNTAASDARVTDRREVPGFMSSPPVNQFCEIGS
jgi:hypothetical protein